MPDCHATRGPVTEGGGLPPSQTLSRHRGRPCQTLRAEAHSPGSPPKAALKNQLSSPCLEVTSPRTFCGAFRYSPPTPCGLGITVTLLRYYYTIELLYYRIYYYTIELGNIIRQYYIHRADEKKMVQTGSLTCPGTHSKKKIAKAGRGGSSL